MTLWEAALLGVVQGVFMFLPVSSTAHLVLTQHLLIGAGSDLPAPESPEMILFDMVVHVGTLVSIAIVFRRSLAAFLGRTLSDTRDWLRRDRDDPASGRRRFLFLRLALLGLLSVFVTGVLGLAFKSTIERVFATPEVVAATLAITGVLLWWTDRLSPRRIGLGQIGLVIALTIGVAQALALVPGISRSGITIVAALLLGLKRRWAAEYSFFIAFPTILAATLVQGAAVFGRGGFAGLDWPAMAVGFVVAAAVGVVALRIVLALLYRAQLKVFSFYLWALAALVAFGVLDDIL